MLAGEENGFVKFLSKNQERIQKIFEVRVLTPKMLSWIYLCIECIESDKLLSATEQAETVYGILGHNCFESLHRERVSDVYLTAHQELKYFIDDYNIWKEVVRLLVRLETLTFLCISILLSKFFCD